LGDMVDVLHVDDGGSHKVLAFIGCKSFVRHFFEAQTPSVPAVRIMSLQSCCCLIEMVSCCTLGSMYSSIFIPWLWYVSVGRKLAAECCPRKARAASSESRREKFPGGSTDLFRKTKPFFVASMVAGMMTGSSPGLEPGCWLLRCTSLNSRGLVCI
jgi:hypothetical protein